MSVTEIVVLMLSTLALYVGTRDIIIGVCCFKTEISLNSTIDDLNDWLDHNPGVYVGLSVEGKCLVEKCIKYLEFVVRNRDEIGMRPIGFDTDETLKYLRSLLDDYPTLPSKIERPERFISRVFLLTD